MGFIDITIGGSFPTKGKRTFTAMTHGHAHAVREAIAYLAGDVLRKAINQDHLLHGEGDAPHDGFAAVGGEETP
jgi:hypothetical protein